MSDAIWVLIVVWLMLLGLIPGLIAHSKGHSFWFWWFGGAMVFIVALPIIIIRKPNVAKLERRQISSGDYKRCPFCAELIRDLALVCRYCGHTVVPLALQQLEERLAIHD